MYERLGSLINWEIGLEARPKFHLPFFTFKPQKNLHGGGEEGGTHVFSECKVSLLGEENKRSLYHLEFPTPLYLTSIILHGNK
jgi:hypothetical protein